MNKRKQKLLTCGILMLGITRVYGQGADSIRTKRILYLQEQLQTDSVTARRVMEVQWRYKQSLKSLLMSGMLSESQKRRGIDSLMSEKNRFLGDFLTEDQRNKLIPTTERRLMFKRDTTTRTN